MVKWKMVDSEQMYCLLREVKKHRKPAVNTDIIQYDSASMGENDTLEQALKFQI